MAGSQCLQPVVLGELPSGEPGGAPQAAKLGVMMQTLTPDLAQSMGMDPDTHGAVITEIAPGSPADKVGLNEGELIVEIDRKPVSSAEEALALLRTGRKGGHLLRVRGPSGARFVTLGSG